MLKAQLEKKVRSLESEVKRLEAKLSQTLPKSKTSGKPQTSEPPTETRRIKLIYDIEIRRINFHKVSYLDWEKLEKLYKFSRQE